MGYSDQESISNYQLFIAVIFINIATAIFFLPGEPVTILHQNAWMAMIVATFLEIVFGIYPLVTLAAAFPRRTMIQYSSQVLGRFGGKIIGLLLIFWFFQYHCWTLREFGEISIIFLPETPLLVFVVILSALTVYAVYQGIEVIVRCGEFIFPIGLFFLFLIGFVNLGSMNISHLMPFFEVNVGQIIKASISPLDWLSAAIGFGVLAGFVNNPQKVKMVGLLAACCSGMVLFAFTIMVLLVFGAGFLAKFTVPLLSLSEYIQLQGTEALVVAVWFSWIFMRTAIWSYITVISIAQLLNLSDYRPLIMPETLLAVVYCIHQYKNFIELSYYFTVAHFLYLSFQLGIPLVLWLAYIIKQKVFSAR